MKLLGEIEVEVAGLTEPERDFICARGAFVDGYCAMKGWKYPLTVAQIFEIRRQPGWIDPLATPTS